MAKPTTVSELVAQIEASRARLDALLLVLSDDQIAAPVLEGGWSTKDVLLHLAFWQYRLRYGLANQSTRAFPASPPEFADLDDDDWVEQVNIRVYEANREMPAAEARDAFAQSYQATLAIIGDLSDHDVFSASGLARRTNGDVLEFIAGNTYEHYDEHCDAIERAFPPSA